VPLESAPAPLPSGHVSHDGSSTTIALYDASSLIPSASQGSSAADSAGSAATNSVVASPVPARPSTHLQHGIRKPKVYMDDTVRYTLLASSIEPRDHCKAMKDARWRAAMDKEFGALQKNQTWHLVPRKDGANNIDCK
jgi:hypothetical protein